MDWAPEDILRMQQENEMDARIRTQGWCDLERIAALMRLEYKVRKNRRKRETNETVCPRKV